MTLLGEVATNYFQLRGNQRRIAVAIFTEGPNHVKHVGEVMKHGKHAMSAVPASLGGGLEEAEQLLDTVKKYGLTYMMAETSYYQQPALPVASCLRMLPTHNPVTQRLDAGEPQA